jgi:putative DNA primase/helicase
MGTSAEELAQIERDIAAELAPVAKAETNIKSPGLEILCLADVKPKPIDWLWKEWLAIGKVSILAGEGGKGKSTVLCDLAARTTRGLAWPDGSPGGPPGSVIILAAEDDVEDTLVPRLMAAGADMSKVYNIRSVIDGNGDGNTFHRSFNLQADLERLETEIRRIGDVRFNIIDPISSYLGKGVDSHKNADVRSVLEPVGEMAARTRTAILCNNHFSKGGGSANNRMIGSVGFINYCRAGFIVTPDAQDESRLLLMPSKMNIAPIKYGLAYRIGSHLLTQDGVDIITSQICWELDPVQISADEALAAHEYDDERSAKAEASDFLTVALAAGPRPAKEVSDEATARGITPKPLRDARRALGVLTEKDGMAGGWVWSLPKAPSTPEDAHHKTWAPSDPLGAFGEGS